ncbi:hypothetical protein [Nostoc sp.]
MEQHKASPYSVPIDTPRSKETGILGSLTAEKSSQVRELDVS